MSKEQIEKMARDMDELLVEKPDEISKHHLNMAAYLYGKGWRCQEWISVEDRLPDYEGYFLVWNEEQNKIEIRFFYRLPKYYPVETYTEIREYFGNCADHKKITHWKPLPEPPKK